MAAHYKYYNEKDDAEEDNIEIQKEGDENDK